MFNIFNFIRDLFRKKETIIPDNPGLLAKDPTDVRDYLLSSIQPAAVSLPEEFDLRDKQSEVQNQDGLGICYSFAVAGIGEYWNTKEYHQTINLSERFIVHNTKKISGLWNIQADYFRNALKAFCDYGSPLEKDYPFSFNWADYKKEPPADLFKKAEQYKGKTFWRVGNDLETIKQAVFQNNCPVLIGMRWYKSYNKPEADGKLPLPSGKVVGGHAISGGYWTKGKIWIKNSYNKNWGNNGYSYIPFNEFLKHEIWDPWILLDIKKPVPDSKKGFVAMAYLKPSKYSVGSIVYPSVNLNFRKEPSGEKIRVLKKGEKLEIIGEPIKQGNWNWVYVKVVC